MPNPKMLTSQADRNDAQKIYKFGGGKNEIIADDDLVSTFGYVIKSGGGDDMIFGSDFTGRGVFDVNADPRTQYGDLLIGGDGSDTIEGGLGDDTIYGGNEDGTDASKGQNPPPTNELTGDNQTVDFGIDGTYTGGDDSIFGGDGSTNNINGDARFTVVFSAGDSFFGGDDTLTGGDSTADDTAFNSNFGDARSVSFTADGGANGESFTGGDDTLTGGNGAFNLLLGDIQSFSNDGDFTQT